MEIIPIKLKLNTIVVKIASLLIKLKKSEGLASTIGRTIHIKNRTEREFITNQVWTRHEIQHAIQYHTIKMFWFLYIIETIKHGYKNNKYELEAEEYSKHSFPDYYVICGKDFLVLNDFSDKLILNNLTDINMTLGTNYKIIPERIIRN